MGRAYREGLQQDAAGEVRLGDRHGRRGLQVHRTRRRLILVQSINYNNNL